MYLRHSLSFLVFFVLICSGPLQAKTRWSAYHHIPHADFLDGGTYVIQSANFVSADSTTDDAVTRIAYEAMAQVGATRWINVSAGWSQGLTFGFKARILGETHPFVPSLCVGARNIANHREATFFDDAYCDSTAELYVALGKDVKPIHTRFHGGILSIPSMERERVQPFFGVESYAGAGIYYSIEVYRRDTLVIPSVFVTWRVLDEKVSACAGIIGVRRMFVNEKNEFAFAMTAPPGPASYVRPGIFFGLSYRGGITFGKENAFETEEDRALALQNRLDNMDHRVRMLQTSIDTNRKYIRRIHEDLSRLDNALSDHKTKLRTILKDKLIRLKTLYRASPYKPEEVQKMISELTQYKFDDKAMRILQEFALDQTQDRAIRILSIEILGQTGKKSAADVVLDILANEEDPGIRIACIIALGKMNATDAVPLLRQLANAPDDNVALSAQEVLAALTGGKPLPDIRATSTRALRPDADTPASSGPSQPVLDTGDTATRPSPSTPSSGATSYPSDTTATTAEPGQQAGDSLAVSTSPDSGDTTGSAPDAPSAPETTPDADTTTGPDTPGDADTGAGADATTSTPAPNGSDTTASASADTTATGESPSGPAASPDTTEMEKAASEPARPQRTDSATVQDTSATPDSIPAP
jgi:hypothetical protein